MDRLIFPSVCVNAGQKTSYLRKVKAEVIDEFNGFAPMLLSGEIIKAEFNNEKTLMFERTRKIEGELNHLKEDVLAEAYHGPKSSEYIATGQNGEVALAFPPGLDQSNEASNWSFLMELLADALGSGATSAEQEKIRSLISEAENTDMPGNTHWKVNKNILGEEI